MVAAQYEKRRDRTAVPNALRDIDSRLGAVTYLSCRLTPDLFSKAVSNSRAPFAEKAYFMVTRTAGAARLMLHGDLFIGKNKVIGAAYHVS